MNAGFDWLTIIVWSALLWSTLRTRTKTKSGTALKSVALVLLAAFGAMMIWNITVSMR
jgi:ABC-type nickel/cobalt efflux system permease component RcnA